MRFLLLYIFPLIVIVSLTIFIIEINFRIHNLDMKVLLLTEVLIAYIQVKTLSKDNMTDEVLNNFLKEDFPESYEYLSGLPRNELIKLVINQLSDIAGDDEQDK